MKRRLALGLSIPAVILFIGIIVALLIPSNFFSLMESLDGLGLLGARMRVEGLVAVPPGDSPSTPLWLVNGTLWDAEHGARPNPGLGIVDGRLTPRRDPRARVIDLEGRTLLPGLIDMHVHALGGTFDGEMMIGAGVTTARDLGSYLPGVLRHREMAAAGERIGPRLLVTGPYLVGATGTSDQELGVAGPVDVERVVRQQAEAGVDGIKLHWGIDTATLARAVDQAHARGLWVAVHLGDVPLEEAARAGIDTLEHGAGLETVETETAIEILLAHDIALTPTLVVSEHAFRIRALARHDNPDLRYFPRFFRRGWVRSQIANARAARLSEEEIRKRRDTFDRLSRFVGRFHDAGGRVLAGSDAPAFLVPPGFGLHRELELLVAAGLRPAEALEAATREAARALGLADEIGTLGEGMRADLLIVEGDPVSPDGSIASIGDPVMVLKGGHILLDRLD